MSARKTPGVIHPRDQRCHNPGVLPPPSSRERDNWIGPFNENRNDAAKNEVLWH
jgi:hypothetical protein